MKKLVAVVLTVFFGAAWADDYYTDSQSVLWSTPRIKTVTVPFEFPSEATEVVFTAQSARRGVLKHETFAVGTPSTTVDLFAGTVPTVDDAVRLIADYRASGATISAVTAEVAVVRGAFGATDLPMDTTRRSWGSVEAVALVPYAVDWTDATGPLDFRITGDDRPVSTELAGSGWYAWWIGEEDRPCRKRYDLTLGKDDAVLLSGWLWTRGGFQLILR